MTECTGAYSQIAAWNAGFEERVRLCYRDFRFGGRAVFADIGPSHTHLILYEVVCRHTRQPRDAPLAGWRLLAATV